MKEKIEIVTRFNSPTMTAQEYIRLSRSIMAHLKIFHPIFETINSWGDKASFWTRINSDFSNFDSVVFQHIYDDEINYKNPNNEKGFQPESVSWAGFSNVYSNTKNAKDAKYSVSIGAGKDGIGFVNIDLPQLNFDEFYQTSIIKNLISHIAQLIPLDTAYAITDTLFDEVVDFDKPYDVQIGWINFFAQQRISTLLPKNISCELINNGCFFWLNEVIGTPSVETITTALNIRDTLGELGYLK